MGFVFQCLTLPFCWMMFMNILHFPFQKNTSIIVTFMNTSFTYFLFWFALYHTYQKMYREELLCYYLLVWVASKKFSSKYWTKNIISWKKILTVLICDKLYFEILLFKYRNMLRNAYSPIQRQENVIFCITFKHYLVARRREKIAGKLVTSIWHV